MREEESNKDKEGYYKERKREKISEIYYILIII